MTKRTRTQTVTIVGFGSLGTSLAAALHAAGIPLDEIVVRPGKLRKPALLARARKLGAQLRVDKNMQLKAQVIWVCTPDDAIEAVARSVAPRLSAGQVILHSSGALGSDILRHGAASVASAHPMMSFPAGKITELRGVAFALEGDKRAMLTAARLIKCCGGESFGISSEHKTLYHVFGSFCSPLLTALLVAGEKAGTAAGIAPGKLRKLSRPIISRTLENYFSHGGAKALTGPLQRGDVATIQRHLHALAAVPEVKAAYIALSKLAVKKLPVKNVQALRRVLDQD